MLTGSTVADAAAALKRAAYRFDVAEAAARSADLELEAALEALKAARRAYYDVDDDGGRC